MSQQSQNDNRRQWPTIDDDWNLELNNPKDPDDMPVFQGQRSELADSLIDGRYTGLALHQSGNEINIDVVIHNGTSYVSDILDPQGEANPAVRDAPDFDFDQAIEKMQKSGKLLDMDSTEAAQIVQQSELAEEGRRSEQSEKLHRQADAILEGYGGAQTEQQRQV